MLLPFLFVAFLDLPVTLPSSFATCRFATTMLSCVPCQPEHAPVRPHRLAAPGMLDACMRARSHASNWVQSNSCNLNPNSVNQLNQPHGQPHRNQGLSAFTLSHVATTHMLTLRSVRL